MVHANFKGVFATYKNLKSGRKCYWYHRATGRRLRGEPGSPEFVTSYAAAEQSIPDRLVRPGTFNALIREYTLSEDFRSNLAPSTQREYRRMLTKAEKNFAEMPMAALDGRRVRRDFLDWRDTIAKQSGPREADHCLSAISALLTWAEDRGLLSANHLRNFKHLYHGSRSEIIWLPEHIEAFMKVAPIELQRALILALHTGQRLGDLFQLPWSAYDGGTIRLRQGKSRRGQRLGRLIEISTKYTN